MRITLILRLAVACLFMLAVTVLSAQTTTASMQGVVTDASGAGVPGVSVTIKNVETGLARTVVTDDSGTYRATLLSVGAYEVSATKPGFATEVRKGIDLVVGEEATIGLKLGTGAVTESVTVTDAIPVVNMSTSSISGLVDEKQVKDLPLNGRSYDNLIALNAGAVNYTSMKNSVTGGTGSGNYFAVDGRHPDENMFLLNGVEYTGMSQLGIQPGGASGELLGIDAVREFNVISSTYGAEYGGRAGSQINIVTMSGSNKIHGSGFEFVRNSALDARNHFDQATIPPFHRNNYGGSVGGPIRKDKSFLFGNFEELRSSTGLSDVTFVPDNNARMGILPCYLITSTPAHPVTCTGPTDATPTVVPGLSAAMLNYMAYWPVMNSPELTSVVNGVTLPSGIAEALSSPVQTIKEDFGTVRFDQVLSAKDNFYAVYTVDDGTNFSPMVNPFFAVDFSLREQVLSASEVHIFNPHVINTFTAGFSRGAFYFFGPAVAGFPTSSLALVQGSQPGIISIGGGTSGGSTAPSSISQGGSNGTFNLRRNLFTYTDDLQVIKGKHELTAGLWAMRIQTNEAGATRGNGTASFTNFGTFLQGTSSTFIGTPSAANLYWRSWEGAAYLQDTFQLASNLTVRLGLRGEATNGWNEAKGHAANYTFTNGIINTNPAIGNSIFDTNNATHLLGPRVGLTWDPFKNGKTAVRAGFGIHYDLMDNLAFEFEAVAPYTPAVSYSNIYLPSVVPLTTAEVLPACTNGPAATCTIYAPQGVQRNAKTSAVEAWNLTVEQQIAPNLSFSIAYVGSFNYHQLIPIDPNTVVPQICANPSGCQSGGTLSYSAANRAVVAPGALYLPAGPPTVAQPLGSVNTRPNLNLNSGGFFVSRGNASYNALQTELTRRMSHGLQFKGTYTWAQTLDMNSGLTSGQGSNQIASVMNPYNLRGEWGPAAQNVLNQATGNFSYQLPELQKASAFTKALVNGWKANGIVTLLSGFPFTPLDGSNQSGDGDSKNPDRPNWNPNFQGPVITHTQAHWFNTAAFVKQTPGTYGNVSRGALRGPRLTDVDFSMFKEVPIKGRVQAQLRAEFFNIFNHTHLSFPNPTFTAATGGVITATTTTSRQIQFGAKLNF